VIGIATALIRCGRIVESNDEFLRLIGMSRDEFKICSVSLVDLATPESSDVRRQAQRELREVGRFTPFEAELMRSDGSRIPVLIGDALLDGNLRPSGLLRARLDRP
jgi:PAS domain S-box-containing protein